MYLPLELRMVKIVVKDIGYDMVRWLAWWYSRGLWEVLKWAGRGMRREWWNLALGPWLRAMFTPMYGDYSIPGRLISFFARIFILLYRMVVFVFWAVWYAVLIIPYIGLPIVPLYLLVTWWAH